MKQVILIRRDLKMRRGKEIAQGAHAAMLFITKRGMFNPNQIVWIKEGMKKVCVQVNSEEELLAIYNSAVANNILANIVVDSGTTEFNGVPTRTACAIGPDEDEVIDKITGHLKLY